MKAFTLRRTALTFALALAHAQGAWAGTATVALTGSAAPNGGGGVVFSAFEAPALDDFGAAFFKGTLAGPTVTSSNNSGIWRGASLIARTGSAVPGLGSGVSFASFDVLQVGASAGTVLYGASLAGAGIKPSNDFGLWRSGSLVAQEGNAAPGTSGLLFGALGSRSISPAGMVVFTSSLTSSAGTRPGNSVWRSNPAIGGSSTNLIVSSGEGAPGVGSGVDFQSFSAVLANVQGAVAFQARLEGNTNLTNDEGIWRDSSLIVRKGAAASDAGSGVRYDSLQLLKMNATGAVAYASNLAGTGTTVRNSESLWLGSSLIARAGSAAPGAGLGVTFDEFSPFNPFEVQLNDAGQIAFHANLAGLGVNNNVNDQGLWRDSSLIARSGSAAPGAGAGVNFSSFSNLQLNAGGQVAFLGGLTGSGVTSGNNAGLYLGDGRELILAVREGDALAGSTVIGLTLAADSFNSKAQLAYRATLADGRSGVFVYTQTDLRWRSTASGSWADAANWTLGMNPADVHDVAIDAATSLRITGPTGAVTLKSLQVGTGAGIVTLQMAGGSIDAADPVVIGPRGVLTGTGSFSRLVVNQGTVQADQLAMTASLSNAGLVRGVAGGPRNGAGLDADLLNQASGRVLVQPGETLQLRGASHRNLGVFEINQGRLEIAGTLLNGSGGVIDLNRSTTLAEGAWTNAAGARLLLGDARLTVSKGLTNAGQVLVTSGDSDVFGAVVNQKAGQILLSGQGTTTFYDAVELQAGSELRTSAGATAVFFGAVAQRSGALLTGTGHKYFEGSLSVGNSPGLGEDAGSVSLGLGSTYLAEIGGTALGTGYDHYRVAGTLTLGGTLQLVSFAGFTGEAGQSFDLFDWGTLQGQFSTIDSSGLQLAAGTTLDVSRLYTDGVIRVTAVPEPSSWALMAAGLAGLGGWARRRAASTHLTA